MALAFSFIRPRDTIRLILANRSRHFAARNVAVALGCVRVTLFILPLLALDYHCSREHKEIHNEAARSKASEEVTNGAAGEYIKCAFFIILRHVAGLHIKSLHIPVWRAYDAPLCLQWLVDDKMCTP